MLLGPTLWCSGLGCSRKVCLFTRFACETGATTGLGTRVFQNKKLMGGGVGWGEEVEEQQEAARGCGLASLFPRGACVPGLQGHQEGLTLSS